VARFKAQNLGGLRVGVPHECSFEGLDADVQRAVEEAIQQPCSPAVIMPGGCSRDGLPIGLQPIGRLFDEARLLNLVCT